MGASDSWLLYGANGYTGRLIAEEAVRRGESPVLAGRREEAIRPLAESLELDYRIFPIEGAPFQRLVRELEPFSALLLAAGPFVTTSGPMADACVEAGTHYLDITGEIAVFEGLVDRSARAEERGCTLLPGAGFDVVPSDCLAATLRERLPAATKLELALAPRMRPTRGTALTMLDGLPRGGAVREGRCIRRVPPGYRAQRVAFRDRERMAVSIPWGDVSTAYHSTGIGDITVYLAVPRVAVWTLRLVRPFLPLLSRPSVRRVLGAAARRLPGPSEKDRQRRRAQLWGRVVDDSGEERVATLETAEPYRLTSLTALESVVRVRDGMVEPGFQTPVTAFGADFIAEFPDCDRSPAEQVPSS